MRKWFGVWGTDDNQGLEAKFFNNNKTWEMTKIKPGCKMHSIKIYKVL